MPNGKTQFITGAVVGATVNFIIQSAKMAMNYDKPFDWDEFFLSTGAGSFTALAPDIGPRLCRRPAAEMGYREKLPNLLRLVPEPATTNPNHRQFFHNLISAGLIAWAISANPIQKLSRTTRLFLWSFGMSYLSHIALDSATPKVTRLVTHSNRW
jgi:membrane-bound metal-dependent hydrolase YbcI (DUF457 family)